MSSPLLSIENLRAGFETDSGLLVAVDGISLSLRAGGTVGIVGESGCGKSVTAFSINRLLPRPHGRILGGSIRFDGRELTTLPAEEMRRLRGKSIGMIFQEPMTALNPVHRTGRQLAEAIRLHDRGAPPAEVLRRSVEMLRRVRIPAPERRLMEYPHQLSGGMRQRVMIAMALINRPQLLIADEPTTALDVTVQAQILALISELQAEMGMSVILITHDLGVIAETCEEVAVMYAGRIVERAGVRELFANPRHAYTRGLLASIPRLETVNKIRLPAIPGHVASLDEMVDGCRFCQRMGRPATGPRPELIEAAPGHWVENCPHCLEDGPLAVPEAPLEIRSTAGTDAPPLLEVTDLKLYFPVKGGVFSRTRGWCRAVDGISVSLAPGETLGVVGESGCGKTTFGKTIVRLLDATEGRIVFSGTDITQAGRRGMKPYRKDLQMIFQDPAESLNPRHSVRQILEEPLRVHRIGTSAERRKRVDELLEKVGLPASAADRFPFEFSGGQRQRIGIARAIALNPRLIVCDEPVSALDVSVQSQVLNLLIDLQRELGLSYLFISHNLAVVEHMSDRVAVMYLGRIVELASSEAIYRSPRHAYTKALLAANPVPDPSVRRERILLEGDVPSPVDPPPGCAFGHRMNAPRYPETIGRELKLTEVAPGHFVQVCPCCTEIES